MSNKIYKALSDMFSINVEYDTKLVEVKKIIDSCRTLKELESCECILKNIEDQLKNSIDIFSKENRFVNLITGNVFKSFLVKKMGCKMSKINDYYRKKFENRENFEL